MPEVVTESFCERCGTRYTFETAAKRVRLRGLKVMSRGLKTFVLDDKTSFEEAIQAAKSDTDRDATSSQLDAFHQTFNFCMQCRQYTCPNCWNEAEGRCLTCAPLALGATDAPFTGVDHAPGLAAAELAAASDAASPTNGQGANGHTRDDEDDGSFLARLDAMTRLTPVAEPEAIEATVVDGPSIEAPEEPAAAGADTALAGPETVAAVVAEEPAAEVVETAPEPAAEPSVAEPVAAGDADQQAATAAAQTSALFQSRRPVLDAAMVAPVAAPLSEPEPEPVAETLAEAEPEPEALVAEAEPDVVAEAVVAEPEPVVAEAEPVVAEAVIAAAVIAEPEPEPETPSFLRAAIAAAAIRAHDEPASQPEPEPVVAVAQPVVAEPEPEPVAAVAEPEPEPVVAEPEPVVEPIAAVVEPEPEPVAAEPDAAATIAAAAATDIVTQPTWSIHAPDPSAPVDDVALPAAATATPEWPDQPEWPAQQASPGLPFLNRPAVPTGGVEALWAESDRAVTAAPGPNKASAGIQPCVSCGLSLSASARFCRRCGTAQG